MPAVTDRQDEIARELTELRRQVAELEKGKARYQSLFENAPISLWEEDWSEVKRFVLDLRRGGVNDLRAHFESHPEAIMRCVELVRVIDVNRASFQMFHAERKEQLITGFSSIFGEEALKGFGDEVIAFTEGKSVFECEKWSRTLDGTAHCIHISILLPAGYEETWERCFVAVLDVTERAQAEEAQRRSLLQEETIRAQRAALGALSTPVIPISDDILVMPLVGVLDSQRTAQATAVLLQEIAARRATTAIVDITGVSVVDSAVADALIRAAQAVRLLGARVTLTGIRPEVAQVLVTIGVDMRGIVTHGTLQAGIVEATRASSARRAP